MKPGDRLEMEAAIFYALALVATAAPEDKTYGNQRKAAALLEPLFAANPDHPGVAHYLIHAYDNPVLAPQGLAAARAYSKIAPDLPHALHLPSHIFTRLGLWEDSAASNIASAAAARKHGDQGEEFHELDYLVYADLQLGRNDEADTYWAEQVAIQSEEAVGWVAFAEHRTYDGLRLLRIAADHEDAAEKHAVPLGRSDQRENCSAIC